MNKSDIVAKLSPLCELAHEANKLLAENEQPLSTQQQDTIFANETRIKAEVSDLLEKSENLAPSVVAGYAKEQFDPEVPETQGYIILAHAIEKISAGEPFGEYM